MIYDVQSTILQSGTSMCASEHGSHSSPITGSQSIKLHTSVSYPRATPKSGYCSLLSHAPGDTAVLHLFSKQRLTQRVLREKFERI